MSRRRREAMQVVAAIARNQDGVVERRGILTAGVPRHLVEDLVEDGFLHRVLHGMYVVGLPTISHAQLIRCGLLLGGPGTQLSHRTAHEQRELLSLKPGKVTVTSPRVNIARLSKTRVPMVDGGYGLVLVCHSKTLPPPTFINGRATTNVARSLVDLAYGSSAATVARAWSQAEFRGLLSRHELQHEVEAGRRGSAEIGRLLRTRNILTNPESGLRSLSELDFLHLIKAAGLPAPETDVLISVPGGFRFADFLWRHLNLVVELDSADHLSPAAGARDRDRDADFFVAGLDVVRFLDTAVARDPHGYMRRLADVMDRQRLRAA